jgi:transposase-like protein
MQLRKTKRATVPLRGWFPLAAGLLLLASGMMVPARAAEESAANSKMTRWADQFVVHDTRKYGRSLAAFGDAGKPGMIQIELDTLLICAQRVRNTLAQTLQIPARGGGKIHCHLYAPRRNNESIVFVSTLFTDGWQYSLNIPDDVERTKLVRGLVQALLTEMANRGTARKSAEIPTWLIEGLTLQTLIQIGPDLMVDSVPVNSVRRSVREIRGTDSLAEAHRFFRIQKPMGFSELSEAPSGNPTGNLMARYQFSTQLLVARLLEMEDGHAKLSRMLRNLPDYWNWQTAFLKAFGFGRLLDAEKWWWVETAAFTGLDTSRYLSESACLARLDEALRAPARVSLSTNALPVRIEATLTQVVSDWGYAQQRAALQQKLIQLSLLRAAATKEVSPLIDAYTASLHNYLRKRDQTEGSGAPMRAAVTPGRALVHEMVRELARLDEQRAALRITLAATVSAPPPSEP